MDIISNLNVLAAAVEEAEASGFGFNPDILDTNIVNLAIVLGLLVYIGKKFFGKILADRKTGIEADLKDVEQANQEAETALSEQKQNLAQAKAEAERILASAHTTAQASRQAILAQAEEDVKRMRASAEQDLNAEQERVIAQLRQRVITLALEKAEANLPKRLDEPAQRNLVDRSLTMLGGN